MTGKTAPGFPAGRKTRQLPELLAPAGSPAAFRAAVAAGADAVYLGGKRFGARRYAPNFTDDEIREAVRYAHAHGIRVYVTVNTLVHDRELADVVEYLLWLSSIGTDAVLVQDTGLAALAREVVPALPLHASTQMTIHNADGVRWAAGQGFSRVVLARELSLAEIRHIADETQETGVRLEVFGHGALCYSWSGQCLLSSFIGGRSGNRGMCAQPCRKPYTLVTAGTDLYGRPLALTEVPAGGPYLLSTRDLCTFGRLPELVRSPVASLKIEGRMKSPEYVAAAVMAYRKALDAIAAGTYDGSPEAYRDLLLAFNRGFTQGYLFGDRYDTLMGREAPSNRGLRIGTVTRYDRKTSCVTVRTDSPVLPAPGDGLLIAGPETGGGIGFSLNTVPVRKGDEIVFPVPRPASPGAAVSITFSRELDVRVRRVIAHPPAGTLRPVPLDLAVVVMDDGTVRFDGKIQIPDRNVTVVSFQPDLRMEPARSRAVTRDQLELQLRKSGGTPFAIRNLDLTYSGTLFAPLAALNRMRRDFLATAEGALVAASLPGKEETGRARERWMRMAPEYQLPAGDGNARPAGPGLRLAAYTDSLDGVRELAGAGCERICFEPEIVLPEHRCGRDEPPLPFADQVTGALAICRAAGAGFVWKFPRITRDAYLEKVLPAFPAISRDGVRECMVENPGAGHALLRAEPSLALSGAAGLNIFNSAAAVRTWPGFRLLTLSPELSGDDIRTLLRLARAKAGSPEFAVIVQGTGEAMITDDCLFRTHLHCGGKGRNAGKTTGRFLGIRDATGHMFPVRMDGECRTRIGNAAETCLIDNLPSLLAAGVSEAVIDTRGRTLAYTGEICRIYREAVDATNAGLPAGRTAVLKNLKDRVRRIALGGITAGHFTRGPGA